VRVLETLPRESEVILVVNGATDASGEVCASLARDNDRVRWLELREAGWGRAVRAGLTEASGDVLCYTNSARTTPEMLRLMLVYEHAYPNVVLKASRRIRDNWRRRLGSVIYNLEARMLFDLPVWDVNGTPKVFPRKFERLLQLKRDDDLIDLEFVVTCQREEYPIIDVPILATVRHGGKSTMNYGAALRLYIGAWRMAREQA
jgi:glycosyltransferase involved in cell wall biosynthesis